MAASDPVPSVATPTGSLQGAAVFSWDGTTWQPAGAAYSSVATPTGVLRGVAPFTYSGTTWQTGGLSRPGVPTPTGTLDGVAVYTWNGNAWTPSGGGTTPTPSGTLQGVAAFYWDGSAWQPSGKAAPEVAIPGGVLQGMAMFSWSGSAWVPAVSAPALDLNFLLMMTLDPSITFTRASTATYFDATGVMQTAAANVARFDHDPVTHAARGLLIEEARTNVLLNTATLGTQSVAVTAQAYTLSFYGTGTVAMSGAFAGSLVGTGAFPVRVQTTFTAAPGTLTCTVTGSVLNAQLEAGAFVTSYIPTTAAAVTRAVDSCTIQPANMGFYVPGPVSWAAEFVSQLPTVSGSAKIIAYPLPASRAQLYLNGANFAAEIDGVGAVGTANAITVGAISKAASTWAASIGQVCLNGAAVASASTLTTGFPDAASTGTAFLQTGTPSESTTGYIRRVRYWSRVLSNTELQAVTT